ncbi:tryptophan synthase subunit beta [Lachnobacterium bovis]|uniref:tryptophan synthase subunit beta n=1 Tax=Lachnobacterium bovis TaxID=140626 RepID=UPI0003B68AD3|nr:tryptophan synthase subunit beta [Lachnobacterium bovis]
MKIKICGVTREEEIIYINEFAINYVGFVFYKNSKRYVEISKAKKLMDNLRDRIKTVAVTVDPDEELIEKIKKLNFDIIQIHTKRDDFFDSDLLTKISAPLWLAFNVENSDDLKHYIEKFDSLSNKVKKKIQAIVFDNKNFGSGKTFSWKNDIGFRKLLKAFRKNNNCELVLAGGLNCQNVSEGIKTFYPEIVDVSSSLEVECNYINKKVYRKDREKIMKFVDEVKKCEVEINNQMKKGYYGRFGGRFVAESLMSVLDEVDKEFEKAKNDEQFKKQFDYYMKQYVGRETPLYFAEKLSKKFGTKIYLKREDLNHTGAHKINNVIGQLLLAKRMGKTKVIAETGAGQHGVATATGAALFGMECSIFMGKEDIERQKLNVLRMEMLGAKVISVESGSNTLKDATNEAIRTWAKNAEDTFYVLGSAVGPYPYPKIVKHFQSIIGKEAKRQHIEAEGKNPDVVIACVGGGSNSIGIFSSFLDDKDVELIGVEAAGCGIDTSMHASAMAGEQIGILHGMKSYLLQDENGNVKLAHSISAGLDYPGVGPEHAYLKETKRVYYTSITDDEAMDALLLLCKEEGIIPAIESAHAVAYALKKAKEMNENQSMIINLSGRGDKDVNTISDYVNGKGYLN